MKKKLLISLLSYLVTITPCCAMPAKPGLKRMLMLSNGSRVEAQLVGDEHGHFWRSADGRAFIGTSQKNIYKQIDSEQLEQLKAEATQRRNEANERRAGRLASRKMGEVGSYFGKKRGLIILVNFSDVSFERGHNQALYERIANEKGYSEGRFYGSMYDYFYAQSLGQFELEFDIVGPVNVSNTQSYYGRNNSRGDDLRPGEMAREACELADRYVNYADYDWDGDGEVDQVYIVYAGKGEADGGADYTIWPHAWDLRSATGSSLHLDGVRVNTYACGGELDGQTGDINGIGTMCHEFSHCLGYPDFYDTDYSGGQGMGYWDLMDSGSYNGDGYCPAGYTSYERRVAGWLEPIVLTDSMTIEGMQALQDGGEAYIMYNDGHPDEYFLLENRQLIGWDRGVPGHGLLILHVDYKASVWGANSPNNAPSHQRMTWIPADGQYDYTTYLGTRYYSFEGMTTDTYPSGSNNSFGNETNPAAKLYNKNIDGEKLLNKIVYDIYESSKGEISFNFRSDNGEVSPAKPEGNGQYALVTDESQISADSTYLLIYEKSATEGVAFAGVREKHMGVELVIDRYTADNPHGAAHELKLLDAGDGMWQIVDGKEYIGYQGNGGQLVTDSISSEEGFCWLVSADEIINADYVFIKRCLQYDDKNAVFGCYSPGKQKDVRLYVKRDVEPVQKKDPELAFSLSELVVEQGQTDFEKPVLQNPHGLEVFYSSSDENLARVEPDTGDVYLGNDTGIVTISASFEGDDEYAESTASYTLIITIPSGILPINSLNVTTYEPLYDLQGRQIFNKSRLPKGFYISGGRKIVVK